MMEESDIVIDYCTLNKVTRTFTWPMSKVKDIFSKLNGAKYFSTLDLWAGYHHIPLDESSIPKTAFNSPFRKYKYVKVPFGLAQAPAYFQELMTRILMDFNFAITYLDDIIIFSRTAEEHLLHIKQVFEKLWATKLSMKLSKCHFIPKEIQYLGTYFKHQGHLPTTFEDTSHSKDAPTDNPQTSLCLPWISWVLQEIYQGFCQNSKTIDFHYLKASEIWMESSTSWSLPETKRIHHTSTNSMLSKSQQEIHI